MRLFTSLREQTLVVEGFAVEQANQLTAPMEYLSYLFNSTALHRAAGVTIFPWSSGLRR